MWWEQNIVPVEVYEVAILKWFSGIFSNMSSTLILLTRTQVGLTSLQLFPST